MNQSVHERQLVLTESLTSQIQAVLQNQKELSATTEELKRQNMELKKALEKKTRTEPDGRIRKRQRRASVDVPDNLRSRFKKVYALLVSRNVIQEYHLDQNVLSEDNCAILTKMKEELRREHGGENCPWTDLEMEVQFKTYFKTRKEREKRIREGVNEDHKKRSKYLRRIHAKLERRLIGFAELMPELDKKCTRKMHQMLDLGYMSSEESEFEEVEENAVLTRRLKSYKVRRLSWERKKMKKLKEKLDAAYLKTLTKHARGMLKERKDGEKSVRPCPAGPEWAVRQPSS